MSEATPEKLRQAIRALRRSVRNWDRRTLSFLWEKEQAVNSKLSTAMGLGDEIDGWDEAGGLSCGMLMWHCIARQCRSQGESFNTEWYYGEFIDLVVDEIETLRTVGTRMMEFAFLASALNKRDGEEIWQIFERLERCSILTIRKCPTSAGVEFGFRGYLLDLELEYSRQRNEILDDLTEAVGELPQLPQVKQESRSAEQATRFPQLGNNTLNLPGLSDEQIIQMAGNQIRNHRQHPNGAQRSGHRLEGKTFDERFPGVTEWLADRSISHDEAIRRHEEWEKAELEEFKNLNGGITCNPDDSEVLVIKTSAPGVWPPANRIVKTSEFRVVPGQSATVCSSAGPKIPQPLAEEIATRLREIGALNPGQTIHWTGSATGIENVCCCVFPEVEEVAPNSLPSQVSNKSTRRTFRPPPHLSPGYLGLVVDVETQRIWIKDRQVFQCIDLRDHPGQWALFLVMWKAGEGGAKKDAVKNEYPHHELDWSGKPMQLSKLRHELKSYGIKIPAANDGIHKLIKADSSP